MPTNELIENLLFPFILSNAVFLGILFFTIKSDNRKANIYLGLFIWSIAIQIYSDLLWELPIEEDLNVPLFLLEPFLFHLLFLVFYLYKTINKRIKKWYYLLFLPGIFHNVLLHFDGLFLSEIGMTIYESFFYLLEVAFLVYAFRILQKHEKEITDFYSDLEHKSLSWLKRLFILIISIHALLILSGIFEILEVNGAITEDGIRFSYLGIVIFILYWIGYNGFSQPEIFKERLFLAPNVDESIEQEDLIKTEEIEKKESTTLEKDF